jgi:hypothetical protein
MKNLMSKISGLDLSEEEILEKKRISEIQEQSQIKKTVKDAKTVAENIERISKNVAFMTYVFGIIPTIAAIGYGIVQILMSLP